MNIWEFASSINFKRRPSIGITEMLEELTLWKRYDLGNRASKSCFQLQYRDMGLTIRQPRKETISEGEMKREIT